MARVAVFGKVTMEFTFQVDEWPEEGKSVQGRASGRLGGKGLFQAMASHRMGVPTTLISSVANDVFGSKVRETLHEMHLADCVEIHEVEDPNPVSFSTDLAGVIYNSRTGSGATIGCAGASELMSDGFVEDSVRKTIEHVDSILVTFDMATKHVRRLVEMASEMNKMVFVNASPPARVPFAILNRVRYLIATAAEARQWLTLNNAIPEEELRRLSDEGLAELLFEQGPEAVIILPDPRVATDASDNNDVCLVLDRRHPTAIRRYANFLPTNHIPPGARSLFCAGVLVATTEHHLDDDADDPGDERAGEAKIVGFASAAKSLAEYVGDHYDSLPHREAIERIILRHPAPQCTEIPMKRAAEGRASRTRSGPKLTG